MTTVSLKPLKKRFNGNLFGNSPSPTPLFAKFEWQYLQCGGWRADESESLVVAKSQ